MRKYGDQIIAMLKLGIPYNEISSQLGCTKSTISFHAKRHAEEIAPFRKARPTFDWKEVQRYYNEGHSKQECAERFGFSLTGWASAVSRGDIVSNWRKKIPLSEFLKENRPANTYDLKRKLINTGLLEKKCAICGIEDWQGIPLAFDLDHINGINDDNRLENLRILCPNCHSQTETHSGKNIARLRKTKSTQ